MDNLRVILTSLPGDFDLDNDVDGIDFLKWQRGETSPPLDPGDLADWETYYGTQPLVETTAVPEPAELCLAMMSVAALLWRTRKN